MLDLITQKILDSIYDGDESYRDVAGEAARDILPLLSYPRKGDSVRVLESTDGYEGKIGRVLQVFPSGRCQIGIGPINILNLPGHSLERIV